MSTEGTYEPTGALNSPEGGSKLLDAGATREALAAPSRDEPTSSSMKEGEDMSFEDLVDELMHKLGCSKETAVKLMYHIGDTSKMHD